MVQRAFTYDGSFRLDYDGNIVGIEILNASKRMENPRALEYAVA
jgi:uncharacterized protein YuzE